MILKRELAKEKHDEMKYSHFLCTLERANQEKLKLAIMQLKCVPCLNKFTTNFNLINTSTSSGSLSGSCSSMSGLSMLAANNNASGMSSKNMVSHANMSRLLKQMSLIVSTELQQIAIDLVERLDEDKLVKFIKLKDEFKNHGGIVQPQSQSGMVQSQPIKQSTNMPAKQTLAAGTSQAAILLKQQQRQINGQLRGLPGIFSKQMDIHQTSSSASGRSAPKQQIFNPYKAMSAYTSDDKLQSLNMPSLQAPPIDRLLENI